MAKQELDDSSLRLVRWIKQSDEDSSAWQRAKVKEASRRSLRLVPNTQLTETILRENDEKGVLTPRGRRWQCLKDINTGMEMNSVITENGSIVFSFSDEDGNLVRFR